MSSLCPRALVPSPNFKGLMANLGKWGPIHSSCIRACNRLVELHITPKQSPLHHHHKSHCSALLSRAIAALLECLPQRIVPRPATAAISQRFDISLRQISFCVAHDWIPLDHPPRILNTLEQSIFDSYKNLIRSKAQVLTRSTVTPTTRLGCSMMSSWSTTTYIPLKLSINLSRGRRTQ